MTKTRATATVVVGAVCAALGVPALAGGWSVPACATIEGTPAVTYTKDEGATLAGLARPLSGVGYTFGLAPLDTPDTLLAVYNGTVLRSTDAGCSWRKLAYTNRGTQPGIVAAAPGGRAYIWADGGPELLRVDGDTLVPLKGIGPEVRGLAADPRDGAHVRAGDGQGNLWESFDAGASWALLAPAPQGGLFAYRVAFDPSDLDHVLVGTMSSGAFVTLDGGRNWAPASGFGAKGSNVMNLVVAPSDGRTVYAMGIDLAADARAIYRSRDGGLSFEPVVTPSEGVTIVNQPVMAVHPANPAVLYWVFGTSFQNYNTDVYRYDDATGAVTKTHNRHDRVTSLAFNPADPGVMYLGLAVEQGVQ